MKKNPACLPILRTRRSPHASKIPRPNCSASARADQIARLREEGQAAFAGRLNVSTSVPIFLEITAPQATKGNAVAKLAALKGWTKDTVICAGDGLNDLSMMTWSHWPITVKNATPEVLSASRLVGETCENDGIAGLLDELIPPEDSL